MNRKQKSNQFQAFSSGNANLAALMDTDNVSLLQILALEQAINRARAALPSIGTELALSRDVSVLGGLYGEMIFAGMDCVELRALSQVERDTLGRWS
jgi:Protein of unknown function (DUF3717)